MNQIQDEKDWTILIYANGNNELEPEMHQAMLNAEKVGSNTDVNVVIQLGRAKYELVKLIRLDIYPKADGSWSGVRRYVVEKESSTLVGNLKRVNMADPKNLYDFIRWGMRFYPANKYMLILGGHAYQFVGMMTDYSQKAPYIMGIPEMVRAINMAANDMGRKIDALVLDTCYFNSIEVIYELGRVENHSVMSAIMHIKNGAIEGLPYDKIIELVQKSSEVEGVTAIIRRIIENLSYDLVAYEINHQTLKQIKQLFNDAASAYLSRNIDDGNRPFKKVSDVLSNTAQTEVSNLMSSLVIHFKCASQSKPIQGIVANRHTTDDLELISRYYRLGFAQGNYWTRLLSNKHADANMAVEQKEGFLPLKMRPQEVYAYISIMNPRLGETRKIEMLKELYQYKNWV
ncbi:MAG: clostripain-related cysteine peptidase [Pelosinus sp.]|nr:clostripain-related cysteine peptidase [Pelosinus sp.]